MPRSQSIVPQFGPEWNTIHKPAFPADIPPTEEEIAAGFDDRGWPVIARVMLGTEGPVSNLWAAGNPIAITSARDVAEQFGVGDFGFRIGAIGPAGMNAVPRDRFYEGAMFFRLWSDPSGATVLEGQGTGTYDMRWAGVVSNLVVKGRVDEDHDGKRFTIKQYDVMYDGGIFTFAWVELRLEP